MKTIISLATALLISGSVWANGDACKVSLNEAQPTTKGASKQTPDLSSIQREKIHGLYRTVYKTVQGQVSPFRTDNLDSNVIGKAHEDLGQALGVYRTLYEIKNKGTRIKQDEFSQLLTSIENEVLALNANTPAAKRFALLEALRLTQLIEAKVDRPLPETSQDEAKNSKDQKKDKKKDKDKDKDEKKDQEEEDQEDDFEWKDTPKEYSPENKEVQSGKGKKVSAILKSEVFTSNRLYPRQIYDVVNEQGVFTAPLSRPIVNGKKPLSAKDAKHIHVKNTKGPMSINNLPRPDGYTLQAGTYNGYKVIESAPQEFTLVFTVDPKALPDELAIPVMPIKDINFAGVQGLMVYKTPTGIDKKLWPKELLRVVAKIQKASVGNLSIAESMKTHLSGNDYIYFSEGSELDAQGLAALKQKYETLRKSYPKAVAMAHLKSFNCDGAAWIGASLLRDFFGIPTRVVGGATAEDGLMRVGTQTFEVISSGSVGHAWVEVWDDASQSWVAFDMTPKRNTPGGNNSDGLDLETRKDQEEKNKSNDSSSNSSQKSKQSQNSQSNSQQKNGQEQGQDQADSQSQKQKGQGSGDSQQKNKENGQDEQGDNQKGSRVGDEMRRQQAKGGERKPKGSAQQEGGEQEKGKDRKDGDAEGKGTSEAKGQTDSSSQPGEGKTVDRRFDPRQLKSKNKLNHHSLNASLLDAFYAYYLRQGLKRGMSSSFQDDFDVRLTSFINSFKFDQHKNENQAYYLKRMEYLASLGENTKDDLVGRMRWVSDKISSGKLREAWLELRTIQTQLEELKRVNELTPGEEQLHQQLVSLLREFQAVKHPDSGSFDLGDRLNKMLPGSVSRKILSSKYPNFNQVGHLDSQSLAENILSGKEPDLVRMAMAGPYTDLFLNSERIPQYTMMKTFDRSYNPNNPRDIVRTRRISDFPRMILEPKPGEHLLAPTIRGEQFAVAYTETRRNPNPRKTVEKKVSVVYYDVSGSMGEGPDSPRGLQDALIMAFVDRALSEVDPLGRPLHKVFLVPFDDGMGAPLEISTREDAEQLITLQRISYKSSGNGGTEIEPVLMDFYDKVALAHQVDRQKSGAALAVLKKANLVLFSDGGANVDYDRVKQRQEKVMADTGLDLHLSFVAIGAENPTLKSLAQNLGHKKGKSTYYFIDDAEMSNILGGSAYAEKDAGAFAFDQKDDVPARLTSEFQKLRSLTSLDEPAFDFQEFERILAGIRVDTSQHGDEIEISNTVLDLRDAMAFVMKDTNASIGLKLTIVETALKQYLSGIGSRATQLTDVEYQILNQLVRMKRTH